ncbi:MAG: enoyl-CoA hydratase-related protein [bacterium]|nr:enoyl-CoA hydratase-related protein [bacterium]
MKLQTIEVNLQDNFCHIKLNRPEVNNAFNEVMIDELTHFFQKLSEQSNLRGVILSGNGKNFSAGADVQYMSRTATLDYEENVQAALKMANMFHSINDCEYPVIGKIHGAALGGGFGLCTVCDIVIAEENTMFGLTEVRLGILPAVIGPFTIAKIGFSNFRWLGITGERFSAKVAKEIGLVHKTCTNEQLDVELNKLIDHLYDASPFAVKQFKRYIHQLNSIQPHHFLKISTDLIAKVRKSEEGIEGLAAFLEKRKPYWAVR